VKIIEELKIPHVSTKYKFFSHTKNTMDISLDGNTIWGFPHKHGQFLLMRESLLTGEKFFYDINFKPLFYEMTICEKLNLLFCGAPDNIISVFDLPSGKLIKRITEKGNNVSLVDQLDEFVTASGIKHLYFYNLKTNENIVLSEPLKIKYVHRFKSVYRKSEDPKKRIIDIIVATYCKPQLLRVTLEIDSI
jgi:hypothetical protein